MCLKPFDSRSVPMSCAVLILDLELDLTESQLLYEALSVLGH